VTGGAMSDDLARFLDAFAENLLVRHELELRQLGFSGELLQRQMERQASRIQERILAGLNERLTPNSDQVN
jgi:hypothetical protein